MEYKTVLWVEDAQEVNQTDQANALSAGFKVLQKRNLDVWENCMEHLDDFVAVVFVAANANSERVFRNIKAINDHRMVAGQLRPVIVVVPLPSLPARAKVDFSLLACCVLPNLRREQVFSFLEVLIATQAVIDKRGTLIWQPALTGHPIVIGPRGLHKELRLKGLQQKIWSMLAKQCGRIAFTDELAEEAGCDQSQIRIHIERIRDKFAECAQQVGLAVEREDFIETMSGGYRLNAQIKE
jgi:energy-coupling factor transporter ATP-binding protein EcfA2